jgi:predicted DNA-binding transcriptional regulator YafY
MPKKFSALSKQARQQEIYNVLRHHIDDETALAVTEIRNRLEDKDITVSAKTIQRDLEDMSTSHMIESSFTKPTRYYCSGDYDPDYQLTFSESELKVLSLSMMSYREMADPFHRSLCDQTVTIFRSKLPKIIAKEFDSLSDYTIVSPGIRSVSGADTRRNYQKILEALKDKRQIQCENHSPYKEPEQRNEVRTFNPLKLHLVGGEHYLIVYDDRDQKLKRLKICRLQDVKILSSAVPKEYFERSLEQDLSVGGFGGPGENQVTYEICCDEVMATLFGEKLFHPSQSISRTAEGYVIRFTTNPSIEIARYFSGWAKHIHWVSPNALQDEIEEIWFAGLARAKTSKAA